MRIRNLFLSLAVTAGVVVASSQANGNNWLTKAAYNKWHESELEQWLTDHDIPHPAASSRKDLRTLVADNWNDNVVAPYQRWDTDRLLAYLKLKGVATQAVDEKTADKNKLIGFVESAWYETGDMAQTAYTNVKDWIFDSWSDSNLKSFCDFHSIPVPQPRDRDVLLKQARQNYEAVAKKAKKTTGYPGNWLYDAWTDSDLKKWLDSYGVPVPQPSTRDKLIASVRRNSHLAYLQMQKDSEYAKNAYYDAYNNLADTVLDSWSQSELKKFADKNGIKVPQGSKTEEIRALIRRQRAQVLGDTWKGHAASAFGAATSKAGNQYARATDTVSEAVQAAFGQSIDTWSESRLKAFLDARGVPVPHKSSADQLRALVRKNAHKAATGWSAWTFDDMSYDKLRDYLVATGDDAAKKVAAKSGAAREDLAKAAKSAYASASKTGGDHYASVTSYLSSATQSAKDSAFSTWSDSDLKAYLETYGIPVPQGSTLSELRAFARKQATYFRYGTTTPTGTLYAKASENFWSTVDGFWSGVEWARAQLQIGAEEARKKAESFRKKANDEL